MPSPPAKPNSYTFDVTATALPLDYRGQDIKEVVRTADLTKGEFETTAQFADRRGRVEQPEWYAFRFDKDSQYNADKEAFETHVLAQVDVKFHDSEYLMHPPKHRAIWIENGDNRFARDKALGLHPDRTFYLHDYQPNYGVVVLGVTAPTTTSLLGDWDWKTGPTISVLVPLAQAPGLKGQLGWLVVCHPYRGTERLVLHATEKADGVLPEHKEVLLRVTSVELWAVDRRTGTVLSKVPVIAATEKR